MVTFDCGNCTQTHGPVDACMLGVVAMILSDRGHTQAETAAACEQLDVDEFWDRYGGPMVDWVEDQIERRQGD